jgi:hypothetical protein
VERTLGALLPVDLTATRNGMTLIDPTSKSGKLAIKVDNLNWEVKDVVFKDAINLTAVSPDEVVEALTYAGFSNGVTFTVDDSGRIKAGAAGHRSLQLWGFLAGALGFGGGSAFCCLGTAWRDYMTEDDTITIQRNDQRTEATNIDQTGSHNGLTRIIAQGKRTGVNYALNVKPYDRVFKQMVEGGYLSVPTDATTLPGAVMLPGATVDYEPPLASDDPGERSIELIKIDPMYQPNATSREGEEVEIKIEYCPGTTITPADEGGGAMTISSFNYNAVAGDYTDENGKIHAQPLEPTYDMTAWMTADVVGLIKPAPNFQMMGYLA